MESMFDRLFNAVGGDVALANVLAQKFDDFIACRCEAKNAEAVII